MNTRTTPALRRLVAAVTAASLLASTSVSVQATIRSEMNDLYNGLANLPGDVASGISEGVMASGPSAFHGQTYHTYMGGRVFSRVPVRNIQLANIEMPHFSAGCGGIDMFLGSFSHLDGDKLVEFLRATAMSAVGVITQVALGAITPLLASKLEWAKDVIDKINGMNLNSCEAAQHMVAGGMNAMTADKNQQCIQRVMVYEGVDADQAKDRCSTVAGSDAVNANRADTDPPPFTGNLTWEALRRTMGSASREEREMIMSMVGSEIYYPDTAGAAGASIPEKTSTARAPLRLHPIVTDIATVLYGREANPAANGHVMVTLWHCDDDACMNPTQEAVSIESYSERVGRLMHQLADAIRSHSDLSGEAELIQFINQTTLPVYDMMSIGTEVRGSHMAEQLAETYRDVIAADYAWALLERNIKAGQMALSQKFKLSKPQEQEQSAIIRESRERLRDLNAQRQQALNKVADINNITVSLQTLQRTMSSHMPERVMAMTSGSPGAGATGKK
jgi:conjugative transfer pilus assembly protein TraH